MSTKTSVHAVSNRTYFTPATNEECVLARPIELRTHLMYTCSPLFAHVATARPSRYERTALPSVRPLV